jgi:hypothetical protein
MCRRNQKRSLRTASRRCAVSVFSSTSDRGMYRFRSKANATRETSTMNTLQTVGRRRRRRRR